MVYGNPRQPMAGYCIFNDVSARDIQAQEFIGGFCLAKDMAKGNQLGPYLVTADEVGDPFALQVVVEVDGKLRHQGSTAEIEIRFERLGSLRCRFAEPARKLLRPALERYHT